MYICVCLLGLGGIILYNYNHHHEVQLLYSRTFMSLFHLSASKFTLKSQYSKMFPQAKLL